MFWTSFYKYICICLLNHYKRNDVTQFDTCLCWQLFWDIHAAASFHPFFVLKCNNWLRLVKLIWQNSYKMVWFVFDDMKRSILFPIMQTSPVYIFSRQLPAIAYLLLQVWFITIFAMKAAFDMVLLVFSCFQVFLWMVLVIIMDYYSRHLFVMVNVTYG